VSADLKLLAYDAMWHSLKHEHCNKVKSLVILDLLLKSDFESIDYNHSSHSGISQINPESSLSSSAQKEIYLNVNRFLKMINFYEISHPIFLPTLFRTLFCVISTILIIMMMMMGAQ
jgi:hypothetical protein